MSYKFQRLREKLRQAVASGELVGKLPGERALAKRFHVNAKTLSKALTDLAAEGLLDRSIGRGTYVRGSAPAPSAPARWLVLCDQADDPSIDCVIDQLRRAHGDMQVATSSSVAEMRPSFLNGFGAVVDLAADTPESFLRDLVVRNLPVVAINREPKTYSTHAVMVDLVLGTQRIARDLLIAGHRRIAAAEPRGNTSVSHTLRQFAARYRAGAETVVETFSPAEIEAGSAVAALAEGGFTAVVCDSIRTASRVKGALESHGVDVPGQLSLAAVGCLCGGRVVCPCSGYFVDCEPLAEAVVRLLAGGPARPTTLWLAGEFVDRGTTGPVTVNSGDNPWMNFGDAVA
jgi:DNA-binding transcriptional regulator YhcF (GntR family)